ncbi:MAG: hypothetical protein JW818_14430 [Pirellulales bacterium]|nr:hypothetical protein [Pirellulales bacterium]
MRIPQTGSLAFFFLAFSTVVDVAGVHAVTLTVELTGGENITSVGAIQRWDRDGNPTRKVDPKAQIDKPRVDAKAVKKGPGRWVFEGLKPGKYDLVLMGPERVRIEGWQYAPVLEFDPFVAATAKPPEAARAFIDEHIRKSPHYENKVVPLAMAGDEKAVRVLVMLLRDLPTSYTKGAGTLRFEIWQYTNQYGGWVKGKRTRVMHRILMQVAALRRWTWAWDPKLGGIEVGLTSARLEYTVPDVEKLKTLPGLLPY